jgi:hypothetical protein
MGADRGIVDDENLESLAQQQLSYLLGIGSQCSDEAEEVLRSLDQSRWQHFTGTADRKWQT